MKYLQFFIFIIILIFINCETGFNTESKIELELNSIYPKQNQDVPINSSIVITFNMPVDAESINKNTLQIVAEDGTQLDISCEIMSNVVVVDPALDQNMAPNTEYTIHINNISNLKGKRLKILSAASFITGATIDTTPPTATEAKATVRPNEVIVSFNEPLKYWELTDNAVELFDLTNNRVISGSVNGIENSNQVRFTPDESLLENIKYRVTVNGNAGIIDMADNEYTGDSVDFEIFAAPYIDNDPPYITRIQKLSTSDSNVIFIVYFSEKINSIFVDNYEYNETFCHYKGEVGLIFSQPIIPLPVLCNKAYVYPLNNCANIQILPDIVSLNDSHDSILINITEDVHLGRTINIYINKNALRDLSNNRLINNGFYQADFANSWEDENYIVLASSASE